MDTLIKEERLIKEDHYSCYDYEIWTYHNDDNPDTTYYSYKILDNDGVQYFWTGDSIVREANEYYDSEEEALLATIEHINLLENGEG